MCDIFMTTASKTLSNLFSNLLSYIRKFEALKIKQRLLRNLRDIYSKWKKKYGLVFLFFFKMIP